MGNKGRMKRRPWETTGDLKRPRKTTQDHGRPREATSGHPILDPVRHSLARRNMIKPPYRRAGDGKMDHRSPPKKRGQE